MSGLESIALAVAHLEKMKTSSPTDASEAPKASSERSSMSFPAPAPPARVVSLEDTSILTHPIKRQKKKNADVAVGTPGTTIAAPEETKTTKTVLSEDTKDEENNGSLRKASVKEVIAYPRAWLEATKNIKFPKPDTSIQYTSFNESDVLCGRGGETNHHPGNIQYRSLVKAFQPLYIEAKRRDKPRIAQCITYTIRVNGGRFLKRSDPRSNTWTDVGSCKSREKTSQALREGAPELRGAEKHNTQASDPSASAARLSSRVMPSTLSAVCNALNSHSGAVSASNYANLVSQTQRPSAVGPVAAAPYGTPQQILQSLHQRGVTLPPGPPPHLQHHHHHHYNTAGVMSHAAVLAAASSPPPLTGTTTGALSSHLHAAPPSLLLNAGAKRPSIVSSESGDSADVASPASHQSANRGPRIKRLKLRLQQGFSI